jgi:hypothetical protein
MSSDLSHASVEFNELIAAVGLPGRNAGPLLGERLREWPVEPVIAGSRTVFAYFDKREVYDKNYLFFRIRELP